MKFRVTIELEHVSGPEQDEETLIDWFAAAVGQQNGAKPPVTLTGGIADFGEAEWVYIVKLVDA